MPMNVTPMNLFEPVCRYRRIYSNIFIGAQCPMNVMGRGLGCVNDRWPDIFIG
jgi:hypothetical protein